MVYYLHILFIYLLYLLPFNFFSFFSHSLIFQFFSLFFLPTFHFSFTCSSSFHHTFSLFTFSVLLFFLLILPPSIPLLLFFLLSLSLEKERERTPTISLLLEPWQASSDQSFLCWSSMCFIYSWQSAAVQKLNWATHISSTESSLFKKRLFLSFMGHNKTGSKFQNDFIQSLNFTLHLWQYCKRSQNTE